MHVSFAAMLAAACALGGATCAQAQPLDREPTEVVVYADGVNFHDARSVAAFDERLRLAAIRACDSGLPHVMSARASDSQCARESWETAVRKLNQPLLSQLHGQAVDLARNDAADPAAR